MAMKRMHFFSWIVYPMFFTLLRMTDGVIRLLINQEATFSMSVIVTSFVSGLLGGCAASALVFFPFLYLVERLRKKMECWGEMREYMVESGLLISGLVVCFLVLYMMAGAPPSVWFVIFSRPGGALILSSLAYLFVQSISSVKRVQSEDEQSEKIMSGIAGM